MENLLIEICLFVRNVYDTSPETYGNYLLDADDSRQDGNYPITLDNESRKTSYPA